MNRPRGAFAGMAVGLVALLPNLALRAQGSHKVAPERHAVVTGIVRDLAGVAVPRIRISVGVPARTALSDSAGRFEVTGIPTGEHLVVAAGVGYDRLEFSLQLPEPGRLEVDVTLHAADAAAPSARPASTEALDGHVRDATGAPIANVEITALPTTRTSMTDSLGRFRLADLAPGPYLLRVRRLGYEPRTLPARVGGDVEDLVIRLEAQGVVLATTTVVAERGRESFHVPEYLRRKSLETGSFIEREEIERRKPALITDLFRSNTTLTVQRDRTGRQWVETRMSGQRRCVPILFLDGVYYRQEPGLIDGMAPPDQVRSIEVYYGRGTVPAAFFRPGSECGVVAIWTR